VELYSQCIEITPIGTPVTMEISYNQESIKLLGYVIYGTSTMLVYTTGHGVNGFTLNPAMGLFYLSHPNMKFAKTVIFTHINEGNYIHFPQG
jgi:fructose-1,6-bisphosphatase I